METGDSSLFDVWIENWKDLTAFEVVEIGEKPGKTISDITLNTKATLDELLLPFAQSIYVKCRTFNELEEKMSRSQRARLLEAISTDIKKCSNYLTPEVSREALKESEKRDIDLYTKNWHDQNKFDRGRLLFHFEHCVPISAIVKECQKQCSEEAILDILKRKLRVAWILKSEDKELTRLGYKTNRPNPCAAYIEAKIELILRDEVDGASVVRCDQGEQDLK